MSQEEKLREMFQSKMLLQTRSSPITEMAWSYETNSLDRTPKHSFITLLLSAGAVISLSPLPASLLQTSNTSGT